jgi:hypothetical protein
MKLVDQKPDDEMSLSILDAEASCQGSSSSSSSSVVRSPTCEESFYPKQALEDLQTSDPDLGFDDDLDEATNSQDADSVSIISWQSCGSTCSTARSLDASSDSSSSSSTSESSSYYMHRGRVSYVPFFGLQPPQAAPSPDHSAWMHFAADKPNLLAVQVEEGWEGFVIWPRRIPRALVQPRLSDRSAQSQSLFRGTFSL